MSEKPGEQANVYFMDSESGSEMARLINQDQLVTKGMGGLLAEQADLAGIQRVLDLACGPGGWALNVATAYPQMQVVGVDISSAMIEYAQAQAQVRRLHNIRFQIQDIQQPLNFPAASFDLINARLIGFIKPEHWPILLQQCKRLLRPGGVIRLTETDTPVTTSAALQKIHVFFAHALKAAGQSFSPDGELIGTMPMLAPLLRRAGYQHVQLKAHVIEWSSGTDAHDGFQQTSMIGFKTLQPFLTRAGVTTQEELDRLYEQFLLDMQADDFCAIYSLLTAWGEKPVA
jgi:SAM-dependent methyltransferase